MNKGVVQQVGTPLEVYNLPNNEFVAGFLGSPAMNFIPCQVRQDGNTLIAQTDGWQWQLSLTTTGVERLTRQRDHLRGNLIMGIRPEDLLFAPGEPTANTGIPCRVTLIEHMGATNLFILQAGKHQFTASTPADFDLPPGSQVTVQPNASKLHFFDATNGRNLTL